MIKKYEQINTQTHTHTHTHRRTDTHTNMCARTVGRNSRKPRNKKTNTKQISTKQILNTNTKHSWGGRRRTIECIPLL